jgi:hypothetical protein
MMVRISSLRPVRFLPGVALAALVALLFHCGPSRPDLALIQRERVSFWHPYLLYLKAAPHSSIYVEIDAVEGAEPEEAEIARLVGFLETYCRKPDGIVIGRGPAIPRLAAAGESEESLALRYLDGPPPDIAAGDPAFIYILYYDSTVLKQGEPSIGTAPVKPHVRLLPYPAAIFVDRYYNPWGHEMWDLFVMHEMGHLLGLTKNLAHGDGMHCDDRNCLMNEKGRIGLLGWLLGRDRPRSQDDLCARCRQDLEAYLKIEAEPGLRFSGPVLIRSGRGYHVISLPGFVELYVGSLGKLDYRDILVDARRASAGLRGGGSVWVYYREAADTDGRNTRVPSALENARSDPYELVRRIAERELAAWFEREYGDS